MKTLNNRIKLLRKTEEMTQKEFASRLLFSQSYLSGLENGNEIPSEKTIKLIAYEFGVNEEWLVSGNGEMYSETYEYDRETSSKVANKALLNVMQLLNTDSNAAYSYIADCLRNAVDIIRYGNNGNGDYNLEYLEEVMMLFGNMERILFLVKTTGNCSLDDKHIKAFTDSIQKCMNLLIKNE